MQAHASLSQSSLAYLQRGDSLETICDVYGVTPEQVQAALGYAVQLIDSTITQAEFEAALEEVFAPNVPSILFLKNK